MSKRRVLSSFNLVLTLAVSLLATTAWAQGERDFLQAAFATDRQDRGLLLSPDMPRVALLLANRPVAVESRGNDVARLAAPDSEDLLDARLAREGAFEYCRVRPAPNSSLAPEELKLVWSFPMAYNESMTLDADAFEGHPLYLPDGTIPPAHYLNWGTLFYNRERNLAVGTILRGATPASARWGARTGPFSDTQLHLWTQTGFADLEVAIFAWRPKEARLWWAEWYQEEERRTPGVHKSMFPVLSPLQTSWAPGEQQTFEIVPGPRDEGREMDWTLIDDVSGQVVATRRFTYRLPVTRLTIAVDEWPTGLYRAVIAAAGEKVGGSLRRLAQGPDGGPPTGGGTPLTPPPGSVVREFLKSAQAASPRRHTDQELTPAARGSRFVVREFLRSEKMVNLIVRPAHGSHQVLFVAPTDMWRAYASNGGHAMTSWRESWHYDSVGYSPTVLSTRFRRANHYYYGLYERYADIKHYRYLREFGRRNGIAIDYCTQDDIARGRVRLDDYRLVLVGSHAEFTTLECFLRFRDYLARGGAVIIHGGDSFAVIVDYLPSAAEPRYIWQREHVWMHLTYQDDNFLPPRLLPPDAPPTAPITAPQAGGAVDYLNVFHVSVTHWPASGRAVVSNIDHPIVRGLGLRLGDPVPGRWAGESDMVYEPAAWDILVRSVEATTEPAEDFQERVKQPPFHRAGLSVHKNLRLAVVSGENFTGILDDPANTLFRTLYDRTVRYLLDTPPLSGDGEALQPATDHSEFTLPAPATVRAIRYRLPEFIDYADPLWFRKPAPFAHYIVEGTADGHSWSLLADRTHGPWRGLQTDLFPPTRLSKVRLQGTFSDGRPFRVEDVHLFYSQ